jgi:hypothetical protein
VARSNRSMEAFDECGMEPGGNLQGLPAKSSAAA